MKHEEIQSILNEIRNYFYGSDDSAGALCQESSNCTWKLLKQIVCLLTNRKFGLRQIKCEIKEIERKLDELVCNGNGGGKVGGPLSTGPIFVRAGQNNAINVKVQNIGEEPIDAVVKLFNIAACPPSPALIDEETLLNIGGGCCAQDTVLTAPAGNLEVVICPDPADAAIRAFVSVHSGNAPTSEFEYVIRASEMLPATCDFCNSTTD